MQSALRIGRFGPLTISLNYTWLLIAVLGLWWLALLWLPANLPGRNNSLYWVIATATILLFLLSVILREVIRAVISRAGRRSITLYPFGAATPYSIEHIGSMRLLVATIVAPVFSLALGWALLLLAGALDRSEGAGGAIGALAAPLGWLNLWVGVINLIPGMPFDGGRALSSIMHWFTGERDTGLKVARTIGEVASLAIILLGAWRGLTTESWAEALALVTIGWAARGAEESGKQRGLLRTAFAELKVRDFMDETHSEDTVKATDTVARIVRSHPNYPPDAPLAVFDDRGKLVGVIALSAADNLLQGDWPSTPVTSLMTPISEVRALSPGESLTRVVEMIEDNPIEPAEQASIPVIEGDRLMGIVDPTKLEPFEQVDLELGEEETAHEELVTAGFFPRLRAVLPAVTVVAAMAILGSAALRANPYDLRGAMPGGAASITISDLTPSDGATVGLDSTQISAGIIGASAITTASIALDGQFLRVSLDGSSPLRQTITAQVQELARGPHTVQVTAVNFGGQMGRAEWRFWAGEKGAPTVEPVAGKLMISRQVPASGAGILANTADMPLAVELDSAQPPESAQVWLDEKELAAKVAPIADAARRYTIGATMPALASGRHRVRVQIEAGASGSYSTEWEFTALAPDANNAYFKETGYFISQPFLEYWQDNGSLAVFGYPISDRVWETAKDTGETYVAQYFERARFELHPATGERVILGRLGAISHQPEPPAAPIPGARFFEETGHNLSGSFLDFWSKQGGLAVFGYPITEELVETNPAGGKEYRVQYFERSRLELHPEYAGTPLEVQIGRLGAQLYIER